MPYGTTLWLREAENHDDEDTPEHKAAILYGVQWIWHQRNQYFPPGIYFQDKMTIHLNLIIQLWLSH